MLVINREHPNRPDVEELLAESDAYSAALYPPEARYSVDAAFLARPQVRFFLARLNNHAVGCGALVLGADGIGELKRVVVREAARGRGVGRRLINTIEAEASRERIHTIRLETGPQNHAALALYLRQGYRRCGPFGRYLPGPHSVFMEKSISDLSDDEAVNACEGVAGA